MNSQTDVREKETMGNLGLWTQLHKGHMCIAWHLATGSQACIGLLAFSPAHIALCEVNEVLCVKLCEPKGGRDYLAKRRYDREAKHDEWEFARGILAGLLLKL